MRYIYIQVQIIIQYSHRYIGSTCDLDSSELYIKFQLYGVWSSMDMITSSSFQHPAIISFLSEV